MIHDIAACDGRNWLQRKFVWFWDDNLTGSIGYAKELFQKLRPLRKWWWAQCSIDAAQDPDLLRLAANSGCLAVFIGIETFSADNLLQIRKRQNRVDRYRKAIQAFHNVGIAVHAGIIVGLDSDTEENIRIIPEIVESLGIDLPFLNVLTPFPGTPLHVQIRDEGRLLSFEWEHYNGADVTFFPLGMTPQALENAYWDVHHQFYSIGCTVRRIWNTAWYTRLPSLVLNAYANAFFGIQNLISPDRPYPLEKKKSYSCLTFNCADRFADGHPPSANLFTPYLNSHITAP